MKITRSGRDKYQRYKDKSYCSCNKVVVKCIAYYTINSLNTTEVLSEEYVNVFRMVLK